MWQHWQGILKGAFLASLSSIGQSPGAIIFGLLSAALLYLIYFKEPWKEMKAHLGRKLAQAVPVTIVAWLPFYVYQVANIVYETHQGSIAVIDAMKKRATNAESALKQLKSNPVIGRTLKERAVELSSEILAFYTSRVASIPILDAGEQPSFRLEREFERETGRLFADKFVPRLLAIKQELQEQRLTDPELDSAVTRLVDYGALLTEIRTIGDRLSALAMRMETR